MPWRHQFQTTGSIVFTPGRLIWAERAGADYGCGLYIGDFSACWVGDRGPHYPHDLAQPTIPSSRGTVAHDLARREDLVRDFILAASRTYGDAIINSEPKRSLRVIADAMQPPGP